MKKIFVLVGLFLLFTQIIIAQNTWGVKAGANIASQYVKLVADDHLSSIAHNSKSHYKSLFGYQFGVVYKHEINKKWSFGSELNFSVIGSRIPVVEFVNTDSIISSSYHKNKVGYLEIPLYAQYNIHNFYVAAGPAFSLKIIKPHDAVFDYDYSYLKSIDIAANLLTGYAISKRWNINMRYSYGLINTLKDKNRYGNAYKHAAVTNRFFNFSLLYFFK